jgi:hypothetical protein
MLAQRCSCATPSRLSKVSTANHVSHQRTCFSNGRSQCTAVSLRLLARSAPLWRDGNPSRPRPRQEPLIGMTENHVVYRFRRAHFEPKDSHTANDSPLYRTQDTNPHSEVKRSAHHVWLFEVTTAKRLVTCEPSKCNISGSGHKLLN